MRGNSRSPFIERRPGSRDEDHDLIPVDFAAALKEISGRPGMRPSRIREAGEVVERYPFRISAHFMRLIRYEDDPVWRQSMPDPRELRDEEGFEDPLAEERLSPVPNLVHRYPDRVLWLVSDECAVHCRFCTRKRRWAKPVATDDALLLAGLDYIRGRREVRDVLLSGGDPMMLPPSRLEWILGRLRDIPHVEIIRIGSRVPCALPGKVTPRTAAMIAKHHPVYMNIHFNHPWEITPEVKTACSLLADAGIPLGSQTVLLRGVNDDAGTLRALFLGLLRLRVRPYYLLQMDLTRGTAHFRTPIGRGVEILRALRNHISGLALPHFVVDLPGGRGKIPLSPGYVSEVHEDRIVFKDFRGELCRYPLLPGEGGELAALLRST